MHLDHRGGVEVGSEPLELFHVELNPRIVVADREEERKTERKGEREDEESRLTSLCPSDICCTLCIDRIRRGRSTLALTNTKNTLSSVGQENEW